MAWKAEDDTPHAIVATDPKTGLYEGVRQAPSLPLAPGAYVILGQEDRPEL